MEDDGPRSAPKSLHETIRHDLERRILSGDWPPGYKIPSELDLSEIYGCSRMTVNKVMTQLRRGGADPQAAARGLGGAAAKVAQCGAGNP